MDHSQKWSTFSYVKDHLFNTVVKLKIMIRKMIVEQIIGQTLLMRLNKSFS